MNTDPEEQFEQLLRTSLCAGPYVGSIANLPERAIAIARSRQATSARGDVAFWQHPTRRLVKWATLLASAAIVTIFPSGRSVGRAKKKISRQGEDSSYTSCPSSFISSSAACRKEPSKTTSTICGCLAERSFAT